MIRHIVFYAAIAAMAFAQPPAASKGAPKGPPAPAPIGLVANVGNFIHDVSDVDKSLHFYKDVLGMDAPRPAATQTTEAVLKMYNTTANSFKVGNAQINGSPMRMELAQFLNDPGQKPVTHKWGEAGNSVLMLTVNDLASIEARVKAEKVPVLVKEKKACDGRGMVVADPDGFPVALIERPGGAAPAPVATGKGPAPQTNITLIRFGYLVSGDGVQDALGALGLKTETRTHICAPIEEALIGQGKQPSIVGLPGGFEVWLFPAKAASKHDHVRPRDPGAAVLRLSVTDTDQAVAALKGAGLTVASKDGETVSLSPTLRAAILNAPDDLLIQVVK